MELALPPQQTRSIAGAARRAPAIGKGGALARSRQVKAEGSVRSRLDYLRAFRCSVTSPVEYWLERNPGRFARFALGNRMSSIDSCPAIQEFFLGEVRDAMQDLRVETA